MTKRVAADTTPAPEPKAEPQDEHGDGFDRHDHRTWPEGLWGLLKSNVPSEADVVEAYLAWRELRDRAALMAALAKTPVRESPAAAQIVEQDERVLIDVPEAARIMGITEEAFWGRKQRGQLPRGIIVQTDGRVQIHRPKLLAALEKSAR